MDTEILTIREEAGPSDADFRNAVQRAGEVLRNGGIAAFPTDTVYGLGAVCTNRQAVQKVFAAKGRPEQKPLSILVSDVSQAQMLADTVPDYARMLMQRFWPGALTLILEKSSMLSIPDEVTAGGHTIGIRMPKSALARAVIEETGMPLAAPSANLSGNPSSVNGADVIRELYGRVDLIIDAGSCPLGVSSTILDLTGERTRILREGSVTQAMIDEVYFLTAEQK